MWQILAGAECCLIPVWLPQEMYTYTKHMEVCVCVRILFWKVLGRKAKHKEKIPAESRDGRKMRAVHKYKEVLGEIEVSEHTVRKLWYLTTKKSDLSA